MSIRLILCSWAVLSNTCEVERSKVKCKTRLEAGSGLKRDFGFAEILKHPHGLLARCIFRGNVGRGSVAFDYWAHLDLSDTYGRANDKCGQRRSEDLRRNRPSNIRNIRIPLRDSPFDPLMADATHETEF